jgi:hypothetical protein
MGSSKLVCFHCEVKIPFGEPAFVMGGEGKCDFIPANVDVRMMGSALGEAGNGVHKFDGGCKIPELKSADDGGALFGPFGQKAKGGFGLSSRILCHIQVMP